MMSMMFSFSDDVIYVPRLIVLLFMCILVIHDPILDVCWLACVILAIVI